MNTYEDSLVSVVIPCYNHEAYIAKTIESVLNQTHKKIEVLVGDDCSTDGTRDVLKQISDPRVKCYYYEKNIGTVLSLNYLLEQAKGEYICMLGSDDAFMPEKMERQLAVLSENPSLGAVFTEVQAVDENDIPYGDDSEISKLFHEQNRSQSQWIRYFFETGNHLCHSSVMIPRRIREEIGAFDCIYRQLHDFDYWMRLIFKHPIEIIPNKLTVYRRERETRNSVSAALTHNDMRVMNEYTLMFSRIFEMIPKALFEEAFSDFLQSQIPLNEDTFRNERFRVLKELEFGGDAINGSAVRFFVDNIAPFIRRENIDILSSELLSQFYELTGKPAIGEQLIDVQRKEREATEKLRCELEMIYSSRGWKMLEKVRRAKRVINNKL